MKPASLPANEQGRIRALQQTGAFGTAPESAFDRLTALAARICDTPIALITLVDVDRQWFKSHLGLEITETPRNVSFCAHAILHEDLFVVEDALRDERFADNPLVQQAPKIRFYAGYPLHTADGYALGSLCVIDHEPHPLTAEQAAALRVIGRHAAAMLDVRRLDRLLDQQGPAAARNVLRAVTAQEQVCSAAALATTLQPLLDAQLDSATALLHSLGPHDPLRGELRRLHECAQRARSALTSVAR